MNLVNLIHIFIIGILLFKLSVRYTVSLGNYAKTTLPLVPPFISTFSWKCCITSKGNTYEGSTTKGESEDANETVMKSTSSKEGKGKRFVHITVTVQTCIISG